MSGPTSSLAMARVPAPPKPATRTACCGAACADAENDADDVSESAKVGRASAHAARARSAARAHDDDRRELRALLLFTAAAVVVVVVGGIARERSGGSGARVIFP